ncbi:MATE family efflux transporter [Actinoplanes utahensis]|nr:MATE family efflux transporter [Actinoplanes utahensis]
MTKGTVLRTVVAFAVPLTLANLLQQAYLLSDSIIVGRYLGAGALAAVGASQPLYYLLNAVFLGIGTAFTIRLARLKGGGETAGMPAVIRALTAFTLVWSVACMALAVLLAGPILGLMGIHGQLAEDSHEFLTVLSIGFVPMFGTAAISAFLRGLGDSKTPLYILTFSSLLNIVLVFVFVGPMGRGLAGAAFATVLASVASLVTGLVFVYRRYPVPWRGTDTTQSRRELTGAFRLGLPLASQHVFLAVGIMFYVGIVSPLGEPVLAGLTVVNRIELFTAMIFLDLSGALTAFVAQNLGRGDSGRIVRALREVVILAVGLTVVVSGAVIVLRTPVAAVFTTDPAVQTVIVDYILITYPFFVLYTVMVVIHGCLNGLGRTTVPLICTVLSFLVIRLPLSYLVRDGYGVHGVMWAVDVGWLAGLAYTLVAAHRHVPRPAGRQTAPSQA